MDRLSPATGPSTVLPLPLKTSWSAVATLINALPGTPFAAAVAQHGVIIGKTQSNKTAFYNLDMILAIGYRVRSPRGIQFRQYASTVLKEYLTKGFAMDGELLPIIFRRKTRNSPRIPGFYFM